VGNLGVLLFFRGEYAEAVKQLRSAITIQPDLWKIQALLGLAEGRLEDHSGLNDLQAAFPHLTEEKIQAEVGQALINNYTATGDLEKASTVVSTLLAARPTDTNLLYLAYRLHTDLAGKAILTLALSAPGSAQMHQVMARELVRHQDNTAAIANYREAIRLDPQLPGIHSEFGDLLYRSTDPELKAESESEFKAALGANPRDEKAQLMLGLIALRQGKINTAYTDCSRAVELDPNDGDAVTELGKILVEMNDGERARQMFERAIQIDPANYIAHYRLGTLYREAGKPEEAKQEVVLYLKYKHIKDDLAKVFHDMRIPSEQDVAADANEK
jgi:cytochrome c-type biogenesis protein CcmH/NrfG